MRILVARRGDQSLPRHGMNRLLRVFVHILIHVVAVINSAELNRLLSGLGKTQSRAAALARNAQVGHLIPTWISTQRFGRNLLQASACTPIPPRAPPASSHESSGSRPSDRSNGKFFAVSPHTMSTESHGTSRHLGCRAMHIDQRLRPQVADPRVNPHPAFRRDHDQPIKPARAAMEAAERRAQTHAPSSPSFFGLLATRSCHLNCSAP